MVDTLLRDTCTVAHAPFSGDGGACDTRYGLQCGPLWLGNQLDGNAAPVYDVVIFNFGLHDTNDLAFDEEARDEFVPLAEYGPNLDKFAGLVRSLQPTARLGWLSSTPMHFDMHLNSNVVRYNAAALGVLVGPNSSAPAKVDSWRDMYNVVVANCSTPPYYGSKLAPNATHHCPLIADNEEYHYNAEGYALLAANVAAEFRKLLAMGPRSVAGPSTDGRSHTAPHATGSLLLAAAPAATVPMCPDNHTGCPSATTCIADSFSNSKWGCCTLEHAVDCGDSWHCCPMGTLCHANGTNPVSPSHPNPAIYSHVCVNSLL